MSPSSRAKRKDIVIGDNHAALLRIALAQSNLVVGDLAGNVDVLRARIREARERRAGVVVFPELSITGYPPEDLLLKPGFVRDTAAALEELAVGATGIVACVGAPVHGAAVAYRGARHDDRRPAPAGRLPAEVVPTRRGSPPDRPALTGAGTTPPQVGLHNAAAVLADGRIAAVYRKHHLPNYAIFDERRYFAPGDEALVLDLDGPRLGVTICEDIWAPGGPAEWAVINGGAQVVLNLSASPYHRGKGREREALFAARCRDHGCFLAFCNAVGGQDELVFDGHSLVIGPDGTILARGAQFEEDLLVVDIDLPAARALRRGRARRTATPTTDRSATAMTAGRSTAAAADRSTAATPRPGSGRVSTVHVPRQNDSGGRVSSVHPSRHDAAARSALNTGSRMATPPAPEAEIYRALTLGTADYVRKNGFPGAVLGLSGGIDSALALTIAADAIGSAAVTGVSMPSRYTAAMNRDDAAILARRLGVRLLELPIEDLAADYAAVLADSFADAEPDVTEENLQARIRGNLLMALSNKFGWLVLTTGNKSEMSVGYATLYGDMAGGFAVLKDVLKTWVYRLAIWRNRDGEVIPQRIIDKPPTAELRADQRDADSLPPYDVLDGILTAYVEEDRSPAEIEALGYAAETVEHVVQLVDRAEYKRRQAPPGVRISTRAFGKDRRLPITNRYAPGRRA